MEREPRMRHLHNPESSIEDAVDLRPESEVFQDHERLTQAELDEAVRALDDVLREDSDGIIHLDIPSYRYDMTTNPFVDTGKRKVSLYEISRMLDVVLLHRFILQDVLVAGICSRDYTDEKGRAGFVKRIRERGGILIRNHDTSFDIIAADFTPYTPGRSLYDWFAWHHQQPPQSDIRPHLPIDIWMVYDAAAYSEVPGLLDFRHRYRLRQWYDRPTSLIGLLQVN